MPDVLFVLLLALVVLGPKKLPDIARQIGKYLAQFQRMKRELQDQLNVEMLQLGEQKENKLEREGRNRPPGLPVSTGSEAAGAIIEEAS
ncbi:MAG: twin-arginine translocase TatA/TatE family subunit [Candidatus Korobacteraceae bacterium]